MTRNFLEVADPAAPAAIRIERSVVGSLQVDTADVDRDMDFEFQVPRHILLCRVIDGEVEYQRCERDCVRYGRGDMIAVAAPDNRTFSGSIRRGCYEQLAVDRGVLKRVAPGPPGDRDPVGLAGAAVVAPAAGAVLAGAMDYVRRISAVLAHDDANPLVVGAIENHIASLMLAALPCTPRSGGLGADPGVLRRAMAYIDDNAHRDITVVDIADHLRVTSRALQLLFRRHRDCTPLEYVRRVRLDYAHRDLLAGSRETTSVSTVARRWGFTHLGRFAVYYREYYGQSPHVTLRTPS